MLVNLTCDQYLATENYHMAVSVCVALNLSCVGLGRNTGHGKLVECCFIHELNL